MNVTGVADLLIGSSTIVGNYYYLGSSPSSASSKGWNLRILVVVEVEPYLMLVLLDYDYLFLEDDDNPQKKNCLKALLFLMGYD